MRRFVVIGCSNVATTPEEISRARVTTGDAGASQKRLAERLGIQEIVYLSTCHRTEWFLTNDTELCPGRLLVALGRHLPALTDGEAALPPIDRCVALQGEDAARHLFRVACGLESLMVGENQVLGQVKAAFRTAQEAGLVGPFVTTLFDQAIQAAKRVRTMTSLGRGPVSLASLAERTMERRLAVDRRDVAVLGAGEMAALAIELVRKIDPGRPVVVYNRGRERGAALAARVGASFQPLPAFPEAGSTYAVVIGAAATPEPLVGAETARRLAPALLLDLGTPGNVDAACAAVPGIELVDQHALSQVAAQNREARAAEIAKADAIIEEQIAALGYEVMERELSPVARTLRDAFRATAHQELARLNGSAPGLSPAEIEAVVERLSQRLLRVPMRGLREVASQHSTAVLDTFLAAVGR
jgi:glutamyl-tRNA reductase